MKFSDLDPVRLLNHSQSGFTAFELVIVMLITSILASVAIPKIGELRDVRHRSAAKFQVSQHLRWIQAKSVEQGCRGLVKISPNGKRYELGCDYIPFDSNDDPSIETKFSEYELPGGVSISTDNPIIFSTRGQSIDQNGGHRTVTVKLSIHSKIYETGILRASGFYDYD
ncbi:MAG TPA: prepilin-type N-terminal cleavage/methylation domain-containing protein [Oligoflexia bacterium]|nr:prepilin-type N-terminal cleavage/methylation domain-containing protein [Oligoflexia bacterium]HMP47978.1 prepilin-type N-terminal cleavage/methylation domain-containing protein [Oligoflexia bacterium]